MLLESLLIGVNSNFIYDAVKMLAKDLSGYDKDDLQVKIFNSYDKAEKQFYQMNGDKYGTSNNSFLVREQNRQTILKSIFFSSNSLTIQNIDPNGFNDARAVDEEGLSNFIMILEEEFHKDFDLDRILVVKAKLESDKLFQEKVESILKQILIQNSKTNNGKIYMGEPPSLSSSHVKRGRLSNEILDSIFLGPTEVIGASGSGKTMLASQLVEYLKAGNDNSVIFYLQIKNNHDFLDVFSATDPLFTILNNAKSANTCGLENIPYEERIRNASEMLNNSLKSCFIILDFIDGSCNDNFARDLGKFLELFHSKQVHLVALGQESIFRELSGLQRIFLKIPQTIYIPGFDFEEFLKLATFYHGHDIDRASLWSIFEKLTAGRNSGLLARLADIIACCDINDMKRFANYPPGQILERADREKYEIIAQRFREAEEKIVCFILPFNVEEAINVFDTDYIGECVIEMLRYGLLRYHDGQLLEMHETTRAGLEDMVPPRVRRTIHEVLAEHYISKNDVITGILHMEKAGNKAEADGKVRELFLRGDYWSELNAYVIKHKLIDGSELVKLLEANPLPDKAYLLPEIFQSISDDQTAQELRQLIVREFHRFAKDFQWARLVTEAIIACDKSQIYDLVDFGIQKAQQGKPEVLENIIFGINLSKITILPIDKKLQETFLRQQDEVKVQLVPLLLMDKRREVLSIALLFLQGYHQNEKDRKNHNISSIFNGFRFKNKQEIIEFIAAIPLINRPEDIIRFKSVQLKNLGNYIWENRFILRPVCKELLNDTSVNEIEKENAIRILAFLNDPDIVKLAEKYIGIKKKLGSIALFILNLFPDQIDVDSYNQRLLDISIKAEERIPAFYALLQSGIDIDTWFIHLINADSKNVGLWEHLLLLHSIYHPCKRVVSTLKKMINEENNETSITICATLVMRIGELEGEDITDFLIELLSCPRPRIRFTACLCLQYKRSRRALPALLALCRHENDGTIAQTAIEAAIASYPQDFQEFNEIWIRFPQTAIWRVISAGRMQIASEIDYIIGIAADHQVHWQIRRAAIHSASQFKSKVIMKQIADCVLMEKSSFSQDKNSSLLGHNILSALSLDFAIDLCPRYRLEKEKCHEFLADVFDAMKKESMFVYGAPSGKETAKWFFERLETIGWPEDLAGADQVVNEIHIPLLQAAALRGLRFCGSLDEIEEIMVNANTEWLLMRSLCEVLKGRILSVDEIEQIRVKVGTNPFGNAISVQNILNNYKGIKETSKCKNVTALPENKKFEYKQVTYAEIKQALKDGLLNTDLPLLITEIERVQFLELVQELSPENDFKQYWVSSEPKMKFTNNGFTVSGGKPQTFNTYAEIRTALRPALVAANRFQERIPWHQSLLEDKYKHDPYSKRILTLIVLQKDSDRLYEELTHFGDIYLTLLDDYFIKEFSTNIFDQRMIFFLRRWADTEKYEIFEVLCRIVLYIDDSSIDEILSLLLNRCCELLKHCYQIDQEDNIFLWRSLNSLKKHSRFLLIPAYDLRLAELLTSNIPKFHRNDIVEILFKSSRMYAKIESILIKETNFEHFWKDEVDKLDEAGQDLFVLEGNSID